MLRRFTIQHRIFSLLLINMLCIVGAFFLFYMTTQNIQDYSVTTAKDEMIEGRRESIKLATDTLSFMLAKKIDGMPKAEQHIALQNALTDLRYEDDNSGYFFILQDGKFVAFPPSPQRVLYTES